MKRNTAKVRKISIGFNALLCSNGVPLIGFNMFNGMESMLRRLSSNAISTRCSSVSFRPKIPPEQTRMPAFLAFSMVDILSS